MKLKWILNLWVLDCILNTLIKLLEKYRTRANLDNNYDKYYKTIDIQLFHVKF